MWRSTISVAFCFLAIAYCQAADNSKGIDSVLEKYRSAVAKADQVRNNAIQKARDEAINLLVKSANEAYSKKDRIAETRAWTTILQLDRNHSRAQQYFKDLGTLDAVLTTLPKSEDLSTPTTTYVGKWRMYPDGQMDAENRTWHYIISADLTIENRSGNSTRWKEKMEPIADTKELSYQSSNCYHRCIVIGDRLIIEQWCGLPNKPPTVPTSKPNWIQYGFREVP